ncbi:2-amino-4-hydroxy-6-hydroxymethyldihydropteridine diphosphokinase [Woeseia oceani]|uniref:2-amino-4-hydroxy-6-hydroxymethyldihydropteridine pyrophosphokinase n=1 Tax=Woeseia oceani TaxID=1548547 RepID=A0A193LGQ9_9GAMM|nr:2-amino-4-hydroxy-6-hydroxymethyldihydropteridine diphosphokinase [Woeseia oceani]ANO51648.1 2-amino-4-hydroxy-6-hydroxymethyldihydropteridine diphosphokinase [Woeseia oceani]
MSETRPHWWPAFIGIGSNLGEPVQQVEQAIKALAGLEQSRLILCSSLYRSAPVGPQDQPDFINAVVAVLTRLAPQGLLTSLQAIENVQGRTRSGERWGPRTLDLDLLVYGQASVATAELTLPHPRIAERNFVLLPLSEIAPHLPIPGLPSVPQLVQQLVLSEPAIERLTR